MSSDKIVYTVPGYKILKDLQNEILEEQELESKFQTSELHKSNRKDLKAKLNTLGSQKTGHIQTIVFSELASPTHNLDHLMKDNLNITSMLLRNKKPNTATGLTSERLKGLTMNSNFNTTNNFFTNKQTTQQSQNLDATTLSRIVIRNSKKAKTPINVNESRMAMIPAGHTQLPSVVKDPHRSSLSINVENPPMTKIDLLRLRHDEAKLEKIIASNDQRKKEFQEVDELVKKKLEEKNDLNNQYFNKKDQFWKSFFDSNKLIDQFEVYNKNYNRRMDERIQSYQDDKYRRQWLNINVGKNKPQKSPLIFGREDLRNFEGLFLRIKKGVRNTDETYGVTQKEREELKRSKTNLSKVSSDKE